MFHFLWGTDPKVQAQNKLTKFNFKDNTWFLNRYKNCYKTTRNNKLLSVEVG